MQTTLFGGSDEPSLDPALRGAERIELDDRGAWVERVQGWVRGHEALFERLREGVRWRRAERVMYERRVAVPRLLATVPDDGDDPILGRMAAALGARYGYAFDSIQLALYRDGRDSVAWHRDQGIRHWPHGCVAVASLGGTRRFALRPLGGGPTRSLSTGWGDLVVMGGTTQRRWEHAIPKARHAEPRMALMFRHARPER